MNDGLNVLYFWWTCVLPEVEQSIFFLGVWLGLLQHLSDAPLARLLDGRDCTQHYRDCWSILHFSLNLHKFIPKLEMNLHDALLLPTDTQTFYNSSAIKLSSVRVICISVPHQLLLLFFYNIFYLQQHLCFFVQLQKWLARKSGSSHSLYSLPWQMQEKQAFILSGRQTTGLHLVFK